MATERRSRWFGSAALIAAFVLAFFPGAAGADLQKTAEWGAPEGPPFNAIGDLAIGPGGTVGVYDQVVGRARVFTADGNFIRGFSGPLGRNGSEDTVSLDFREDGSITVFDRPASRLHQFSAAGVPTGQIDFDIPGNVRDFSVDPDGGYIAASGDDLRLTRFDESGAEVLGWATARVLGEPSWGGAQVEFDSHDIDDRVFLATGTKLGMFSRSGEFWATWSVADEECGVTGPGLTDLALDGNGNIFLLADLSATEDRNMLFKLDQYMNILWREAIDSGINKLAIGPGEAIYLAGSDLKVRRFTRTEPAVPVPRWNCEQPPAPKKFELLGVKYGPKRAWARVRFHAPEAGKVTVSGPKIRRRSVTVADAGNGAITVRAKPKFMKPARPRRQLKLAVQITFKGDSGQYSESTRVHLKGKLRRR